jgi:hypothetical protein
MFLPWAQHTASKYASKRTQKTLANIYNTDASASGTNHSQKSKFQFLLNSVSKLPFLVFISCSQFSYSTDLVYSKEQQNMTGAKRIRVLLFAITQFAVLLISLTVIFI